MFKKTMTLVFSLLLIVGCSSNGVKEDTASQLEEELQLVKQQLKAKESEIARLETALEQSKSQLDNENQGHYIMILQEEVPKVWGDADVQPWEYLTGFWEGEKVWKGGATNWGESEGTTIPNFTARAPSLLLNEWLVFSKSNVWLGVDFWETTLRINYLDENTAEGFILYYGFHDDSVAGTEFKLLMKKENEFWYIETIEERVRCFRDVSEDGELCV